MTITISLTDLSGNPISPNAIELLFPMDDFSILGTPNFIGTATPNQTVVPSLPQIGGGVITIFASLPAPIPNPALDPANAAQAIELWKSQAANRTVDSFRFEAIDFVAEVDFGGAGPTIQQLVRRYDWEDDILDTRPVVNGSVFDPGSGGGGGGDEPIQFTGDGRNEEIVGGSAVDILDGAGGDDTITGGGSGDWIYGGDGDDVLLGGAGNDELYGGPGFDRLTGGPGDDRVFGDSGRGILKGGPGNDVFDARDGDTTMKGGAGDDILGAYGGTHKMLGGAGNDTVYGAGGEGGITIVKGGKGNDALYAGGETVDSGVTGDRVFGGAGRDSLQGSWDDDTLFGGAGRDVFIYYEDDGSEDNAYQFGSDVIGDFNAAEDALSLAGFGLRPRDITDFSPRLATLTLEGYGEIEVRFTERTTQAEFFAAIEVIEV